MKLSFWQWVGVVVILSMITGFFLRYRAIKALAEIEKDCPCKKQVQNQKK